MRATDNAGNTRTSAAVSVAVDNTAAPTVTLTAPAAGTVSGSAAMTATASDDLAVARVDFLFDDYLIASDSVAPYTATWNTLNPVLSAFDGPHTLTARAYDAGGQVTSSGPVAVTVANRTGAYRATITASSDVPAFVFEDDEARARTEARPATRALLDAPIDSEPGATARSTTCNPTGSLTTSGMPGTRIDLSVTNDSADAWPNGSYDLWYRWFSATGEVVFEGAVDEGFGRINAGAGKTFSATVHSPALCGADQLSQYRLRFDIWDPTAGVWFAEQGNAPVDRPVAVGKELQVAKNLSDALGLERYYQYWGTDVGAGMGHMLNLANGNSILRWTPLSSPGRGLSTVVDLTYNSLEDHSDSPVGNNWSLAISSLTRLGGRLDIHPNNADNLAGNANRWIAFADGDGTTHRFEGSVVNGVGVWDEPPGVNLYLRDHATATGLTGTAAIDRKWALTRPDGVTFYYRDDGGSPNNDGYPTAVSDRNGNELTFTLEAVAPGDDPGGNHFRVTAVTDAGGRAFTVDYYTKAEAHKPQIRGKVQSITDHTGSRISFEYFDDGNLRRLTQAGGTNADGSVLADRTFVFSYTTPNGSGPAITDAALRYAADAKTTQSTRLYSVFDPLRATDSVARHETTFSYVGPGAGTGLTRWKLSGVTDRANQTTAFAYDLDNRLTTVTAPLSRVTRYAYDTDGKVTSITDPTNRVTSVAWSDDFQVASVDEPGQGLQRFTYNVNGYLTDRKVKTGVDGGGNDVFSHTRLAYEHLPADSNDVTGKWEPNRNIAHISQLISKVDPNGMASDNPTGTHDWTFDYDSRGNLTLLIDPEANQSVFTYSATDGTLLTARDANGHFAKYESYDANGFPQIIHEGLTSLTATPLRSTRFAYDADGLLLSVQDPNHFALGSMTRANSAFFDYDAFHRLGRQSAPKSTDLEPGQLIWSAASYDANDNLVRQIGPHFGSGYTGLGAPTETVYDSMDRPTLVTGPDTTADPAGERTAFSYDAAGRLTKVTAPKGVASGAIADDFSVLYTYDPLDRIVRQTRHEYTGSTISRSLYTHACYDANDDLTRVTAPNADIASVTCTNPPPTHTTLLEYDAAHRQTATIDPEGHRTQTAYDRSGNVVTTKDALGRDTAVEFDQRNLPVQVTQPFILPATGVDRHDVVTRIAYDAVGNRSALISPRAFDAAAGGTTYDDYVTTYLYDALNRPVRTDLPTDADFPQQQFVHSIFDANGNLTWNSLPTLSATPPTTEAERKAGGTVAEHWDPGWMATSDSPDATPAVHFDYQAEGWQAMRAPELPSGELNTGEQMFWSYFTDGMLRQRNDRGGQRTTYEYDANNNLTEAIDAAGVTAATRTPMEVLTEYTSLDQVLKTRQREVPAPGQAADSKPYTFTKYAYDRNDNVLTRVDNGTQAYNTTTEVGGRKQEYVYDEADWVTTQFDRGPDSSTSAWSDDQRIRNTFFATGWEQTRIVERATSSTTFTPKQTTEWDYFANGKLAELTISDDAGATLQQHNVEYLDAAGNYLNGHRTLDAFTLLGPDGTAPCRSTACQQTYHYDPRDRLISHNDGKGTTIDYSLDLVGNIAEEQTSGAAGIATKTYAYLGNQLQTVTDDAGTQRHFYDPNGNLACVTVAAGDASDCPLSSGATPSNQVLAAYRYDYLDRLASYRSFTITGSSSTLNDSADYDHDALDRVAAQTESHVIDGSSEQRHTVMNYLGLTALVSGEQHFEGTAIDPNKALTNKAYSYDAWGHRIALSDDETLLGSGGTTNPAAKSYTYAYDVHGSVSLLLDDSSTATASYGYRPYGGADDELTAGDFDPSNEAEAGEREHDPLNAFRYSGRRLDTGSGSIDMGARRYGPDTGRFLQRDFLNTALGDLGLGLDPLTQGRYNFAGGNPISFVETDGHVFIPNGGGTSSGGGDLSDDPQPEEDESPTEDAIDLRGPFYREQGVEPTTAAFDVPRKPGFGTLEIDLFIAEAKTPSFFGLTPAFLGDDRGFDSAAAPYESRAYIRLNFETGEGFAQVNPSCDVEGPCADALPINVDGDANRINIEQLDNGAIAIQYDLQNSRFLAAPSINGNTLIFPDSASGSFGVEAVRDGYPSFESYQYVDGNVRSLLLVGQTASGPGRLLPPRDTSDYYFP